MEKQITISEEYYWQLIYDSNFLNELEEAKLESWGHHTYYDCQKEAEKQTELEKTKYQLKK
jgi:hypothetical protein